MDDSISILLRVGLAFGLAVVGGGVSTVVGLSHERLCALISLAAGTLLGVTVFAILPETATAMAWWELVLAVGSGYLVFLVISKYVYHVCPACAASHFDEAATHRFGEIALALVIALAVHSTMDGLAMAVGHQAHAHGASDTHLHGSPSTALDLSLVTAICVHKIPEGLALGALLLGAGFGRAKTLAWVGAVEATTILGGLLALWLFHDGSDERTAFWLAVVLAHAGGGFLFLAAHAMLGELLKHGQKVVLTSFVLGVLIIGGLRLIL